MVSARRSAPAPLLRVRSRVRRLRFGARRRRPVGARSRSGPSGIRAGHARRSTDPLPVPPRSAHRRHRRRMVGGRPPSVVGTDGPPTPSCWARSERSERCGRSRPHTPRSMSRAPCTTSSLVPPDGDVAPPPVDVDELDRRDMSGARRINLRRSPLTPEERILGAAFDRPDEIAHREEAHEVRRTWVRRGHGDAAPGGRADRARKRKR